MNTFRISLLASLSILLSISALSQIPPGNEPINYQAVARDGAGDILVLEPLVVEVRIFKDAFGSTLEYGEAHAVTTNVYGMFNIQIGLGTPFFALFDDIKWEDERHWYEVTIIHDGMTYVLAKTSFFSVPYAHISALSISSVNGNTLDEAYDEGGAGDGRIITADSGAVAINGLGDNNSLNITNSDSLALKLSVSGDGGAQHIINNGDGIALDMLQTGDAAGINILNAGKDHAIDITAVKDTAADALSSIYTGDPGAKTPDDEGGRAGYFEVTHGSNQQPAIQGDNLSGSGIGVLGTTGFNDQDPALVYSPASLPKAGVAGLSLSDEADKEGVFGWSVTDRGVHGLTNEEGGYEGTPENFTAGVYGRSTPEIGGTPAAAKNQFAVAGYTDDGIAIIGVNEGQGHGLVGVAAGTAGNKTQAGVWGVVEHGAWTNHVDKYPLFVNDSIAKDNIGVLGQALDGTGVWAESESEIGLVASTGPFNSLDSIKFHMIECDPTGTDGISASDQLTKAAIVAKSRDSLAYTGVFVSRLSTDKPTLLVESKTRKTGGLNTAALQVANMGTGSGIRIDNKAVTDTDLAVPVPSNTEAMRITQYRPGSGLLINVDAPDPGAASSGGDAIKASTNSKLGHAGFFSVAPASGETANLYKQNTDPALLAEHYGRGGAGHFESKFDSSEVATLVVKGKLLHSAVEIESGAQLKPAVSILQSGLGGGLDLTSSLTNNADTAFNVVYNGKGLGTYSIGSSKDLETQAEVIYRGSPNPENLDLSWIDAEDFANNYATLEAQYNSITTRRGRVAHFKQDIQLIGAQLATNEAVLIESNVGADVGVDFPPFAFSLPNPLALAGLLRDHYALKVDAFNAAQFNGNVDFAGGVSGLTKKKIGGGSFAPGFAPGGEEDPPGFGSGEKEWSKFSLGPNVGPAGYFEIISDDTETKTVPAVLALNYDDGAGIITSVGDSLVDADLAVGQTALTAYFKKEDPAESGDPNATGTIFNSALLGLEDGPAGKFETTPHTPSSEPTICSRNLNAGHSGLFTVGDTLTDGTAKAYPSGIAAYYRMDDTFDYFNRAFLAQKGGHAGVFEIGTAPFIDKSTLVASNRALGSAGTFVVGDSLKGSEAIGKKAAVMAITKTGFGSGSPTEIYSIGKLGERGGAAGFFDMVPGSSPKAPPAILAQHRAGSSAGVFAIGDSVKVSDYDMAPPAGLVSMWQAVVPAPMDGSDPEEVMTISRLNMAGGPAGLFNVLPHDSVALPALHAMNESGGLGGIFTVGMPIMDYVGAPKLSAGLMAGMKVSEVPDSAFHNKAILGVEGGMAGFFEITGGMEEDPMKMAPTIEVVNRAKGHSALFFAADSSSTMSMVRMHNHNSGNTLEMESTWGDSGPMLKVLKETASVDGDGATGGLAHFDLAIDATDADCAVEISSDVLTPGHVALKVTPADAFSDAADFEGNVSVAGDMTFDAFTFMDFGPGSTITAGTGGLIDITSVLTGDVTTDDLTVTAGATVGTTLDVSGAATVGGDLDVVGTLSKGSGTFKIDHPLDPYNKYLYHSFVESPDMMNIYNGNITTDEEGFATVDMPEYFDALNVEFRYQLTVIGSFSQAIVSQEIAENQFVIQTDQPNVKVSWQVTGVRNDTFAKDHRVVPEVDKEPENIGTLLYDPSLEN